MRRSDYRGAKCTKRKLSKCEGVCKSFDDLQYKFADMLEEDSDIVSFQANVLLEGLELGNFTTDFVATKADGNLMVRECVYRDKLIRPLTCKILDASKDYWISHGVFDWGIVIDKVKEDGSND